MFTDAVQVTVALRTTGVEVRPGYRGEPWWRIGPDGAFENVLAPSRFAARPADAVTAGGRTLHLDRGTGRGSALGRR